MNNQYPVLCRFRGDVMDEEGNLIGYEVKYGKETLYIGPEELHEPA